MSQRKYDFSYLTEKQLDAIAAMYPKAVEVVTTRRPRYRILAMLAECGAALPEGVSLEPPADQVAEQNRKAAASSGPLPAMLRKGAAA